MSSANASEPCRASRPTTAMPPPWPRWSNQAAKPAVVRMTTARFMPFGPARSGPRSPAVPKVSGLDIRSSRSAIASAEPVIAAASTSCNSSRVVASTSSAIQRYAASRTAGCSDRECIVDLTECRRWPG